MGESDSSIIRNSTPVILAKVSPERNSLDKRLATCCSNLSPLSWPCLSLIDLKSSMPINNTAIVVLLLAAPAKACCKRFRQSSWFGRLVKLSKKARRLISSSAINCRFIFLRKYKLYRINNINKPRAEILAKVMISSKRQSCCFLDICMTNSGTSTKRVSQSETAVRRIINMLSKTKAKRLKKPTLSAFAACSRVTFLLALLLAI